MTGSAADEPARSPEVIVTVRAMRGRVRAAQRAGRRVGVVPTMGALHDGHLSLVAASRAACDVTVATIFVNPTQFGPNEDYSRYPRTMEADLAKLAAAGVDYVFAPEVAEIYPHGETTMVDVGGVAEPLEGQFRPGHFRGVTTVVLKLFQAVPADAAFFGQKDYQQSLVVRQMVADLLLPIQIVVCPIVRESDGLAMSSRNAYLSTEERRRALAISRALDAAQARVAGGQRDTEQIAAQIQTALREGGVEAIDYAAVVDANTLAAISRIESKAVALIAARVGATRLIDNAVFDVRSTE